MKAGLGAGVLLLAGSAAGAVWALAAVQPGRNSPADGANAWTQTAPGQAAPPRQATGMEQGPTLHVDVRLVNVFVNVTDRAGAPVDGLDRQDFTLLEDGRPQKIAVFERQTGVPLSMVLAVDTSGSVHKDRDIEQHAARQFVRNLLGPGSSSQDRMSLLEFSTEVREVVPFTSRPAEIEQGLNRLRGGPATALYDAVYLGAEMLAPSSGRKVMVLVSDGGNTMSSVDYQQAEREAIRQEVMVYAIIDVPVEASAGRDLGGEHAMIALAERTGGRHYYAGAAGLGAAFARVSADLRRQYLLAYYPERGGADAAFRRIEVKLNRPGTADYQLSHRAGYFAER